MTDRTKFSVGDRVTYGREGRTGVVLTVRDAIATGTKPRYVVKSDATHLRGLYWESDLESAETVARDRMDNACGTARFEVDHGDEEFPG